MMSFFLRSRTTRTIPTLAEAATFATGLETCLKVENVADIHFSDSDTNVRIVVTATEMLLLTQLPPGQHFLSIFPVGPLRTILHTSVVFQDTLGGCCRNEITS